MKIFNALVFCSCKHDWTLQTLYQKLFNGYWICQECGKKSVSKIKNKI